MALAEVSDKEPSTLQIWAIGLVAALACLLGGAYRRRLVPVLAAWPLLWFAGHLMEIHSSDIGPPLHAEQGTSYFVQTYLSLAVFLAGIVAGLLVNKRRRTL